MKMLVCIEVDNLSKYIIFVVWEVIEDNLLMGILNLK